MMLAQKHFRFLPNYRLLEIIIIQVFGKRHFVVHCIDPVIVTKLGPAMPEGTAVDNYGFLLRCHIVLHYGAHGSSPGTGVNYGPAPGTVDQFEKYLLRFFVDLRELIGPHIHERLRPDCRNRRIQIPGESI